MRVTSSQVIIDNTRLVKLFNERASTQFLDACESVLDTMLQIPAIDASSGEYVLNRLDTFKNEVVSSLNTKLDLSMVTNLIKTSIDSVMTKVDGFSQLRNTNNFKGKECEKHILSILQGAFHPHDGYSVQNISKTPNSCDILIQNPSFTDIRIESKGYGRDNGADVNATEVRKFMSDLVLMNSHGIMVSVYSGISNKSSIDIDIVPGTNKIAIFVKGTDNLVNVVRLLFRLDNLIQLSTDENTTTITNDSVKRISDCILDFKKKSGQIQTHLNESIRLLKDMMFDKIEMLLVSGTVDESRCPTCHQSFKRLASHKCKENLNAVYVEIEEPSICTRIDAGK